MRTYRVRPCRKGLLLAGASLGAVLFLGCSLTGIIDVNVGECTSDESCTDALNEGEGLYAGCAAFECVSNGEHNQCRRIEGETLDGRDNDCDYLVDESGAGRPPVLELSATEFVSGVPDITSATVASSQALAQIYAQKRDSTLVAIDIESAKSSSVRMMAQAKAAGMPPQLVIDLEQGCFSPTSGSATQCNINQAVTASGSDLGFFAQIKTEGCADGELRVGAIDPSRPDEFIDRGPGFRNPSYRGVATYGTLCTDNGRTACGEAKAEHNALLSQGASSSEIDAAIATITQECGVSHPAIAATGVQALVGFLGAQMRQDVCGGEPIDVFGLVLHERIKQFGSEFAWADPSGDGVPDKIGTTVSARPPAIQSLPGSGFLLAHANEDGKVRLTFVPLQEAPPTNGGTSCPADDCESRDGLETAPITGIEDIATLTNAGEAEGISLTLLDVSDGEEDGRKEAALVVTWVEGCAEEDNELPDLPAFAQVLRLDVSGNSPEVIWQGPVNSLGTTRAFPLTVPSNLPFVVSAFERDDKVATEGDLSGVFVLTRPLKIQAVRITSFDGGPVVDGEVIPVQPADESSPARLRYLAALGPRFPDQFLLTSAGEGVITKATFSSGD